MSNPDASNDAELDKLIEELDKPAEEANPSEAIKDKQASNTLNKLKHDKPEWADKKNDDSNTYEYSDDIDLSDDDW